VTAVLEYLDILFHFYASSLRKMFLFIGFTSETHPGIIPIYPLFSAYSARPYQLTPLIVELQYSVLSNYSDASPRLST